MKTIHQFDCDGCGKQVTLHGYPNGTYEYYAVYIHCTSHNPECAGILMDGFTQNKKYFCRECQDIVDEFINRMKSKVLTRRRRNELL